MAAQWACRDRAPNVSGDVHPVYCVSSSRSAVAAAGCWQARIQAPAAFLRERLRRRSRGIAAQPVQRVSIWDGVQGSFDSGENDQAFDGTVPRGGAQTRSSGAAAAAAARSGLRLKKHGIGFATGGALSWDFRRTSSHVAAWGYRRLQLQPAPPPPRHILQPRRLGCVSCVLRGRKPTPVGREVGPARTVVRVGKVHRDLR